MKVNKHQLLYINRLDEKTGVKSFDIAEVLEVYDEVVLVVTRYDRKIKSIMVDSIKDKLVNNEPGIMFLTVDGEYAFREIKEPIKKEKKSLLNKIKEVLMIWR